jgi:hypothetical protein
MRAHRASLVLLCAAAQCTCKRYQCTWENGVYTYEIGGYISPEMDTCIRANEGFELNGKCRYCFTCVDNTCQCDTNNTCDEWGRWAALSALGLSVFFLLVLCWNLWKQYVLFNLVRDYEMDSYPMAKWQKTRLWGLYIPALFSLLCGVASGLFFRWRTILE